MLASKNDPETEEHRVEVPLPDVGEEEHPGSVENDGEKLQREIHEH